MFTKQFKSLVALLMILAFVIAGCGGAPAKPPEKPASAPAVDAVAVTKEATWDAYKKVVADTQAKNFQWRRGDRLYAALVAVWPAGWGLPPVGKLKRS